MDPQVVRSCLAPVDGVALEDLRLAAAKERGGFTFRGSSDVAMSARPSTSSWPTLSLVAEGHRPAGEAGAGKSALLGYLLERVSGWSVAGTDQGLRRVRSGDTSYDT